MSALERSALAPPERTLVDVLRSTAHAHPEAPAVDDGRTVLTYSQLLGAAEGVADRLAAVGIGRGDRVGIRMPSGSTDLYVAILGVLVAGAAYVPVDADDPRERARLVFGSAAVAAVLREDLELRRCVPAPARASRPRGPSHRRRTTTPG